MRKIRKCPFCNGTTGFKVEYQVHGYGHEVRDFNGNIIDTNREVVDGNEEYYCLDCNDRLNFHSHRLDI